jgi:hypothetical protein
MAGGRITLYYINTWPAAEVLCQYLASIQRYVFYAWPAAVSRAPWSARSIISLTARPGAFVHLVAAGSRLYPQPGGSWPAAVSRPSKLPICSRIPIFLATASRLPSRTGRTCRAGPAARGSASVLSVFRLPSFPSLALFEPPLVCQVLILCSLHAGVLGHRSPVQGLDALRVPPAHLQHLRLPAFQEVRPRGQIYKCRHIETFRAGPCHIRQTVLSSRPVFRPPGEVNDDALFDS